MSVPFRARTLAHSIDLPALAAVVIWAGTFTAVKVAIEVFSVLNLSVLRLSLAAAVLFLIIGRAEQRVGLERRGDLARLAPAGVAFGATQIFWGSGIERTTAGQASILLATAPLWTALLVILLRQESVQRRTIGGLVLCIVGVGTMIGQTGLELGPEYVYGDLLCLAGAMSWATAVVVSTPLLKRYTPLKQAAYMVLFGALALLPLALPDLAEQEWTGLPLLTGWLALMYSGVGAIALGQWLWARSIQRIGATRTMVYYYLQPVLAVVIAAVLLGERLSPLQVAGAVAVLGGIYLARS